MRSYEECNWCQSVIDLKLKKKDYRGEIICDDCGLNLTMRCSACWEQHDEEHMYMELPCKPGSPYDRSCETPDTEGKDDGNE